MSPSEINLRLHPRQGTALLSDAVEILYGGAAGGGKSHLMRVAAIIWCVAIAGLQVYVFRRIYLDLIKNHMEGPSGFRNILAPWVNLGYCKIVDDEIRFWNGSRIFLCHCQNENDKYKYQGAEIHVLLVDELTHFSESIYRFLRARVRAVGLIIPPQYANKFPRIICGSNPGNIGHHWVKAAFIDSCEPMEIRQMPDEEGGMLRQYIPARLDDNPSMATDDPTYRARLRGLGSPQLVKAMEDGDWSVMDGAFFPEFSTELHVIQPIILPAHWTRFRSMDWGSAKPFSVGWYAVSDGELMQFPRGALIKYREWYGQKGTQNNVGLKLTAEEVSAGIKQRESEKLTYGVLDPAAFSEDGGPSIAERMATSHKVLFNRADNARVARGGAMGGWDMLRARLKGDEDGRPMIYFFSTCVHTIRTIPALPHDPDRPEDVDSDAEDHAGDETRYACMSRPWAARVNPKKKPDMRAPVTIGELIKISEREDGQRYERI